MCTELECAICYLTYNAGRRCPRELQCKHTFCESCLLALSRALALTDAHHGPDRAIVCPLCRHITSISAEGKIRVELRVDESAMEQLLVTGVLLEPEEAEPEQPEEPDGSQDTDEDGTPSESAAEDSDLSEGNSRGRLRRSMRKVWQKISGKNARQTQENNLTNMSSDDMRSLALMACYMF
uniref:Si:ch73-335l21.4 n=1 Tax=Neogobius melanostomus TaxID=47308 RepID=A0A8C6TE51_9GOBI